MFIVAMTVTVDPVSLGSGDGDREYLWRTGLLPTPSQPVQVCGRHHLSLQEGEPARLVTTILFLQIATNEIVLFPH